MVFMEFDLVMVKKSINNNSNIITKVLKALSNKPPALHYIIKDRDLFIFFKLVVIVITQNA